MDPIIEVLDRFKLGGVEGAWVRERMAGGCDSPPLGSAPLPEDLLYLAGPMDAPLWGTIRSRSNAQGDVGTREKWTRGVLNFHGESRTAKTCQILLSVNTSPHNLFVNDI